MRIGIDLFPLVPGTGRGGGFHRYTTSLVEALHELHDEHEYVLFVNRLNHSLFPESDRMRHHVVPLSPRREVWPLRVLWQQVGLPIAARRRGCDVVHFPMDTASLVLGRPSVVTIHDLISDVHYPARWPGKVSRLKPWYLFHLKRASARRAGCVITPSQATAHDIARHYEVPSEMVTVVPEAAHATFFASRSTNDRDTRATGEPPYVLSVVSLSPHKNVTTLLDAFARACAKGRLPHELRLIGMPGTGARAVETQVRAVPPDLRVRYLGYVDDDTLIKQYRHASLFVFVPFVEGFGLPVLEALAAGVPVIASDASSLPEVCGDAALLVPPSEPTAVADAMVRVLTDENLRRRLRRAGPPRAKAFSWQRAAEETRAAYERVGPTR